MVVAPEGGRGPEPPAACCSPWTPRCGVPPSRAHARMLRAETGGEDDGGRGARSCQPLGWPRPGPQTWRKDFSFKALLRTRHTLLSPLLAAPLPAPAGRFPSGTPFHFLLLGLVFVSILEAEVKLYSCS